MAVVNKHYQDKDYQGGLVELEKLAKLTEAALAGIGNQPGGIEIGEEVAQGLAGMFDEDSGSYQYQAARSNVMLSFEPAVKLLGSLQGELDKADSLAEGEDYDAGIKVLEKVQTECDRVLDDAQRRWAVKEKEFFEFRKMGERLAEVRTKKIAEMEQKLESAKEGNQTKSIQEFTTQLKQLQDAPDKAKPLNDLYQSAKDLAALLDYADAMKKIDEARKIGLTLQTEMKKVSENVARETLAAEGQDKATFDFAAKTKDKHWGFDSDDDAKNFFVGAATNDMGGLVASDKLKQMYVQVDAALGRLDQLLSTGMDPESAGDIAFKNIPKNFWPDRVVREVLMYKRARGRSRKRSEPKSKRKRPRTSSTSCSSWAIPATKRSAIWSKKCRISSIPKRSAITRIRSPRLRKWRRNTAPRPSRPSPRSSATRPLSCSAATN